jgi:hypothetical protein
VLPLLATAVLAGDLSLATPKAVSPGGTAKILTASGSCPTFSWAAPPEGSIELVVFKVLEGQSFGTDEKAALRAVLDTALPIGALAWTPSADRCFEPGCTELFLRTDGVDGSRYGRERVDLQWRRPGRRSEILGDRH